MDICERRLNISATDATVADAAAAFQFSTPKSREVQGDPGCFAVALDGTSITLQAAYYDRTVRQWVKVGAPVVCLVGQTAAIPGVAGVEMTVQVTARTGTTGVGLGFLGNAR